MAFLVCLAKTNFNDSRFLSEARGSLAVFCLVGWLVYLVSFLVDLSLVLVGFMKVLNRF